MNDTRISRYYTTQQTELALNACKEASIN